MPARTIGTPGGPGRRHRRWGAALAVTSAALCLGLGACGGNPPKTDNRTAERLTDEVASGLRTVPGIEAVSLKYRNAAMESSRVSAFITVRAGTERQPVCKEVIRRLWLSKVQPISLVTVDVRDSGDRSRFSECRADFIGADQQAYRQRYGPRPVS